MKKLVIALLVATVSFAGVAQADGMTLYGSVRMAYNWEKNYDFTTKKTISSSKVANQGSRLGFKGSDNLGNGLVSYYKYENRISATEDSGSSFTTRYLYVGIKGGFGRVELGAIDLPRDSMENYTDPWIWYTPGNQLGKIRSGNAIKYVTPDMSGFSAQAAVVMNGQADANSFVNGKTSYNAKNNVDAYDLALAYSANGIYAGLGYQRINASYVGNLAVEDDTSTIALGAGYGNDLFEVGVLIEREKSESGVTTNGYNAKPVWGRLSGLYNISPTDAIYAGVSFYDYDIPDYSNDYQYSLGYQYKFSKRTRVWSEYTYMDLGSDSSDNGENNQGLVLGLRTDF
ncbi:MAG: porin [Ostreibacterium sp.]